MTYVFDHIHLVVRDVDAMVSFFVDLFDAEIIGRRDDFKGAAAVVVGLAGIRLFVQGVRPGWQGTASAPLGALGVNHFGLTVADVPAAAEALKKRGAILHTEPYRGGFAGRYICYVQAPEEVVVEISGPFRGL